MSESEKLRAEVKILKAEKERAEMDTTQTFGVIPNQDTNVPTDNTGNTIAVQESVSVRCV